MTRKLDSLVAEKVMGWTYIIKEDTGYSWWKIPESDPLHDDWDGHDDAQPHYSSDIAAAWEVRNKMAETHDVVVCHWLFNNEEGDNRCEITPRQTPDECSKCGRCPPSTHFEVWAKTAELAICIAALRAVGVPENEIQEAMQ